MSLMGIAGSGNCSIVLDVGASEIMLTYLIHTLHLPVGMISVCGLVGCMSKIAFFLILRPLCKPPGFSRAVLQAKALSHKVVTADIILPIYGGLIFLYFFVEATPSVYEILRHP